MLKVTITDAVEADLVAVTAIYNQIIATSTAVFTETPVTVADRVAWWRARVDLGYPVLVGRNAGGEVVGFSTFGDFRAWPGYRYTVEHSVHVREDCRGQGVGPQLVAALFPRAVAVGKHVMIAGVDAANGPSIRMHERLGFVRATELREVGYKFGRWLDLVLMQRYLDAQGASR